MMCEECGIRPANFHIVTVVGEEHTERRLCAVCMAKYQKQLPGLDFTNLVGILSGMLGGAQEQQAEEEKPEEIPELVCNGCGMTYEQFRKGGMLGCAECYTAFKAPLTQLLKRMHGNTQHTGHMPGSVKGSVALKLNIDRLQQQLEKAIRAEEYEQAAQLRDSIRAMKAQLAEQEDKDIKVAPPERLTQEGGARDE